MPSNFIKILIILFLSCCLALIDNYEFLGEVYLYLILAFLAYDIISKRNITLLHVWNVGFIFIILSEVFSPQFTISFYSLSALKFLIIANNLVFIGYLSYLKISKYTLKPVEHKNVRTSKLTSIIFIFLVAVFFVTQIKSALGTFSLGRNIAYANVTDGFILASILKSLAFILPSLMAYYYLIVAKTKIIVPLLLSTPIFVILFMEGSRFPILFSFLGFIIVVQTSFSKKLSFKKIILLSGGLIILLLLSSVMKELRSSNNLTYTSTAILDIDEEQTLTGFVAKNSSPEGVIDLTGLMFKYFESNDFLYGSSSSFILYFWIPRQIWPDKPTMIGHWLIRNFRTGFGSGHSASLGFTGDIYSDFGIFSLIIVVFFGRLLKMAELFKDWALKSKGYVSVLGAMFFPFTFFFVRSPITSTMNFLGILFFYFLIKKLIFVKQGKA